MNATCRQVEAPSAPVLSYDMPSRSNPSSGTPFHCLQATSQALQPMQIEVSVKNPLRGGWSAAIAGVAGGIGLGPNSADAGQPRYSSGSRAVSRCGLPAPGPVVVIAVPVARVIPARCR